MLLWWLVGYYDVPLWVAGILDSSLRFGMTPPPCHSEARTPKNLRCLLTGRLVVGMDQSSEADLRFLTPFGMTEGAFGMTP